MLQITYTSQLHDRQKGGHFQCDNRTVPLSHHYSLFYQAGDNHNHHSSRTCRACQKPGIRSRSNGRFENCG